MPPKAKKPSKGVSPLLPVIILSFLNFVTACVLFWFVGEDLAYRQSWTQAIDQQKAKLEVLDKSSAKIPGLKATEELMSSLTEEERRKVEELASEYARRKAAAAAKLEGLKIDPAKIRN